MDENEQCEPPGHRVDVDLGDGRVFTCWLPKPAAELTGRDIADIERALMRHVTARSKDPS